MASKEKPQGLVLRAIRTALRPYARLCFYVGLRFDTFETAARLSFLDAAVDNLQKRGKSVTATSLSELSGISKRNIAELRNLLAPKKHLRDLKSSAAYVLNEWATNPEYFGVDGTPILLPVHGGPRSVSTLCKIVECYEPVEAVLRELLKSGAVEMVNEGECRLLRRAHIQLALSDSAIYHFERTLYTMGETLVANMTSGASQSKLLERASFTYGLDPLALPKFIMLSTSTGANFIENIDEWVSANEDKSKIRNGAYISGVGVYAFHAPAPEFSFLSDSIR